MVGRRSYGTRMEEQEEGNGAKAHCGLDGLDGELADALKTVGRRRRSPVVGDEDGDGDGSTGRSGLRGSAESFIARRRSSQTRREVEGEAVAAAAMSYSDDSART